MIIGAGVGLGLRLRVCQSGFRKLFSTRIPRFCGTIGYDYSEEMKSLPEEEVDLVDEIIRLESENRRLQWEIESIRNDLDKPMSPGLHRLRIDDVIRRTCVSKRSDPNIKTHSELVKLLHPSDSYRDLRLAFNRYMVESNMRNPSESYFFARKDPQGQYFLEQGHSNVEFHEVICKGGVNYMIPNADCVILGLDLPIIRFIYRSCLQEEGVAHGHSILSCCDIDKLEEIAIAYHNYVKDWMFMRVMNSKSFYDCMNIPTRVVSMGDALGDVTVKLIVEGWFPASQTFVELASFSMHQVSDILYNGEKNSINRAVFLVHYTLAVPERALGCILENNQKEAGVDVPRLLQSNMNEKSFLPFIT